MALNNILIKRISIIGDGAWGTTLALHLSRQEISCDTLGGVSRRILPKSLKCAKIKNSCPDLKSLHKYV